MHSGTAAESRVRKELTNSQMEVSMGRMSKSQDESVRMGPGAFMPGQEDWRQIAAIIGGSLARMNDVGLAWLQLRIVGAEELEALRLANKVAKVINVKEELARLLVEPSAAPPAWSNSRHFRKQQQREPWAWIFGHKSAECRMCDCSPEGTAEHRRAAGDLSIGTLVEVTYKAKSGARAVAGHCMVVGLLYYLFAKYPHTPPKQKRNKGKGLKRPAAAQPAAH
jgi:hypothetical protein